MRVLGQVEHRLQGRPQSRRLRRWLSKEQGNHEHHSFDLFDNTRRREWRDSRRSLWDSLFGSLHRRLM